jgi:Chitin binding Peritrophin-A domain
VVPEARFKHTDDCARFFVCGEENRPRLVVCSDGHVYNPDTKSCDKADNVVGW